MDAEDNSYMCDVDGMLQWHAQIKYTAADAIARGTTPAVIAAQANDYVAYSARDFKTALAANINYEVSPCNNAISRMHMPRLCCL